MKLIANIIGLFHTCEFNNHVEKEYEIMYTNKWIIYTQYWCKCGKHKIIKNCGTLNIEDIP